jgi:hypothetical protein
MTVAREATAGIPPSSAPAAASAALLLRVFHGAGPATAAPTVWDEAELAALRGKLDGTVRAAPSWAPAAPLPLAPNAAPASAPRTPVAQPDKAMQLYLRTLVLLTSCSRA